MKIMLKEIGFKVALKDVRFKLNFICSGRSFQNLGAQNEKARSP